MAMQSLRDVFVDELRDALSAEKQLLQALPKIAKSASNRRLRQAIEHHLGETKHQVERLEEVFESLDMNPRAKKCEGIEGILQEGKKHIENGEAPDVRDAMLIAASQKVEHYEIATYGSLCSWAEQLGLNDAARLLRETLDEEKNADRTLTEVAESTVNRQAEARASEEEWDDDEEADEDETDDGDEYEFEDEDDD
jgi:ferritin-like metal-binding protein YciE